MVKIDNKTVEKRQESSFARKHASLSLHLSNVDLQSLGRIDGMSIKLD